ncbi:MAG: hypothetical protein AAF391_10360, partial [Bacteroidota bacterium]
EDVRRAWRACTRVWEYHVETMRAKRKDITPERGAVCAAGPAQIDKGTLVNGREKSFMGVLREKWEEAQ